MIFGEKKGNTDNYVWWNTWRHYVVNGGLEKIQSDPVYMATTYLETSI